MKRLLLVSGCLAVLLVLGWAAGPMVKTAVFSTFGMNPSASDRLSTQGITAAPDPTLPWTKPKSGWLWVLDVHPAGGHVLLVDPKTQTVPARIVTGPYPDIALSPDGSRLYVATAHDLTVLDV